MIRLRFLSNQYIKRTLRPVYAQTQATPYAAVLDPSLLGTPLPGAGDIDSFTDQYSFPANTYQLQQGLVPGTVMIKGAIGENVLIASGVANEIPFGLLGNFVGGNLDELGGEPYVGVWYGPGSVFDLLAPAFDPTGLSAAYNSATPGVPVTLYASNNAGFLGLLCAGAGLSGGTTNHVAVATLVSYSASVIRVKMVI